MALKSYTPKYFYGEKQMVDREKQSFMMPSIRYLIVADGPPCFDVSDEETDKSTMASSSTRPRHSNDANKAINEKEVIEDKTGPDFYRACDCQCTCPCTCECPCTCTCECPCPCQCQCTCPCTCECPGPGGYTMTDEISFMHSNFMLRPELFGGLLFNKITLTSYVCNPSAYEILQFAKLNNSVKLDELAQLIELLREKFLDVPNNIEQIITHFVVSCAQNGISLKDDAKPSLNKGLFSQ